MSLNDLISHIIENEGGLVDDPDDPGGLTKYGITLTSLSEYLGRPAGRKEVINLTQETARALYSERYIIKPGFHKIDSDRVRYAAVDSGVLFGRTRAIKWLQLSAGAKPDGVIGPFTVSAVDAFDDETIVVGLRNCRLRRIGRLVSTNSRLSKYCLGWINRTIDVTK